MKAREIRENRDLPVTAGESASHAPTAVLDAAYLEPKSPATCNCAKSCCGSMRNSSPRSLRRSAGPAGRARREAAHSCKGASFAIGAFAPGAALRRHRERHRSRGRATGRGRKAPPAEQPAPESRAHDRGHAALRDGPPGAPGRVGLATSLRLRCSYANPARAFRCFARMPPRERFCVDPREPFDAEDHLCGSRRDAARRGGQGRRDRDGDRDRARRAGHRGGMRRRLRLRDLPRACRSRMAGGGRGSRRRWKRTCSTSPSTFARPRASPARFGSPKRSTVSSCTRPSGRADASRAAEAPFSPAFCRDPSASCLAST